MYMTSHKNLRKWNVMEQDRIIKYPQIRYHISYDEMLTLKDLEEILHLLRVSNNDVLYEMGISRGKGNGLQRIEKIEPGSIDIVTVLSVISSTITIGDFVWRMGRLVAHKIESEYGQDLSGTKKDKKVYYRNRVTVNNCESNGVNSGCSSFDVNIHIHNAEDAEKSLEHL